TGPGSRERAGFDVGSGWARSAGNRAADFTHVGGGGSECRGASDRTFERGDVGRESFQGAGQGEYSGFGACWAVAREIGEDRGGSDCGYFVFGDGNEMTGARLAQPQQLRKDRPLEISRTLFNRRAAAGPAALRVLLHNPF